MKRIKLMKEIHTFEELENMCWAGALTILKIVKENGKEENLMELLEELSYIDSFESETQLNDFIWFDLETFEEFKFINE